MGTIDIAEFSGYATLMGDYCGVNVHYLVAVAQMRSAMNDGDVDGTVGPFCFSQPMWDRSLHVDGFEPDFESTDVGDWESQCGLFARITRRTLDAWMLTNDGRTPGAIDLYLSQLIADGRPAPSDAERASLLVELSHALDVTRKCVEEARAASLDDPDQPAGPSSPQEVVLFRRTPASAPVRGHLIAKMQAALIARGLLPLTNGGGGRSDDGVFGPDTERSVQAWQATKGHPSTGALTFGQWWELTGEPPPTAFDLCAQLTAAFEGTGFGGTNPTNFDDTILTFGYHGYTLSGGSLLRFLNSVDGSNPGLIDSAFGAAKAQDLRRLCALPHEQAIVQGSGIFLRGGVVDAGWRQAFLAFGAQPECQRLQLTFSRQEYWVPGERMRAVLKLSDVLSSALCFDVVVQNGPTMAIAASVARNFTGLESERDKRILMADAVTRQSRFSDDVRQRKQLISTGGGVVHRASYVLSEWGFADGESAEAGDAVVKMTASTHDATFDAWLRHQMPNLAEFTSAEFLTKGRQDEANHLNTDPPRELWPNILPTIKVLVTLKKVLGGAAVTLNSVYRSPAYNRSVNGALDSQHMRFAATDVVVQDGGTPSRWASVLHQMRSEGLFKGGIGVYPGFVHVDTRGFNADWG